MTASGPLTLGSAALLRLMRLASTSLPVGGFSYSEGLESAIDSRRIAGEAAALNWLADQLDLGLARSELPVVAFALDAWQHGDHGRVASLNAWYATTRETSELRQQAEQMGRSLVVWLRQGEVDSGALAAIARLLHAPTWPVVFALAASSACSEPRPALLAFAAGWAENLVQAAMKSVPLGQAAGQRMLDALALRLPAAIDHALTVPEAQLQAFTPMLAILSARHEAQYSRLFRS